MGYNTIYSLEISPLKGKQEKQVTFDSLIEKGENSQLLQEDMVKYLKLLKESNGESVTVEVNFDDIITQLRNENEDARDALNEDGGTMQELKWYDNEADLAQFSTKYPNWLFTLTGKGEETGDMWKRYFVNGKVQVAAAEIFYEDFDENKLVNVK